MFAKALELVNHYTHPIVISQRFYDGTIQCGMGTFIIINKDGWIMTAAHMLIPLINSKKHEQEIKQYEKNV